MNKKIPKLYDQFNGTSLMYNPKQCWYPFFIGVILGDGHISKRGILTFEQSEKKKEYLFWLWKICKLARVCTEKSVPKKVSRYDKRTGKIYTSWRFNTRTLFQRERKIFYPNNIKSIPKERFYLSNPITLALWFMDDGGIGGNTKKGLVLDLSGYSQRDKIFIQKALKDLYGINTTLHRKSKDFNHKNLYFSVETVDRFVTIIKPFIHKSMVYKLKNFLKDNRCTDLV